MKTIRIVHEGRGDRRVRAGGVLFQDVGGCWHAHVPALGLTGYGWSRQAAYGSLEVVVRVYLRAVRGMGGVIEDLMEDMTKDMTKDMEEGGWKVEAGEWYAPLMGYGQLREVLGYMRRGAIMRPFGLLLEEGSLARGS